MNNDPISIGTTYIIESKIYIYMFVSVWLYRTEESVRSEKVNRFTVCFLVNWMYGIVWWFTLIMKDLFKETVERNVHYIFNA